MNKDFCYKKTSTGDGYAVDSAKSGTGGKVSTAITDASDDIGAGGTEAAKKGTGGTNDWKSICRQADDHSLYNTSSK